MVEQVNVKSIDRITRKLKQMTVPFTWEGYMYYNHEESGERVAYPLRWNGNFFVRDGLKKVNVNDYTGDIVMENMNRVVFLTSTDARVDIKEWVETIERNVF